MLVLLRDKGQSLRIGDDIEITIVSFDDKRVKIGIKTPDDIQVYRKEIYPGPQNKDKDK